MPNISNVMFIIYADLNALPDRPLESRVEIVGATNEPMSVRLVQNYADHRLASGPRYLHEDFRCSWAAHLGLFSSGVLCELVSFVFF